MNKSNKILLGILVVIVICVSIIIIYDSNGTAPTYYNQPTTTSNVSEIIADNTPNNEKHLTIGQQNALRKAQSYLSHSAFSYSGLIKQLEYEGFSVTDSIYAVDNCGANWNEQAAKKAESYLSHSSFSRSGLISQLEYEGFTLSQAEYGVQAVGY